MSAIDAKGVFSKLLELPGANIEEVHVDGKTVNIIVTPKESAHRCPVASCRFQTHAAYDSNVRRWRALPLAEYELVLVMRCCRLRCPSHGVLFEKVPFANRGVRFTADFEELLVRATKAADVTRLSRSMRVAWNTAAAIIDRHDGAAADAQVSPRRIAKLYAISSEGTITYRNPDAAFQFLASSAKGKARRRAG